MELSIDAGAIAISLLIGVTTISLVLKSLQATVQKLAEQLDRLIISAERSQAREEAKAQFAIEALHSKNDP